MQIMCPNCETVNPEENKFCSDCGASLESATVLSEGPAAAEKPKKRRWLVIVGVVVVACVLVAIIGSLLSGPADENTAPTDVAAGEVTKEVLPTEPLTTDTAPTAESPTEQPEPSATIEPTELPPTNTPLPTEPPPTDTPIPETPDSPKGDGFYTVGDEIAPGKWESTGTGDMCYWERLDENQEILSNHVGLAGGTITILDTDYEVQLSRCGTWEYIEGMERPPHSDASEPKGDGFFTVGVEIVPGKWESTGPGDMCYWERLDDHQEILGNHVGLAGGTVTIRDTDYEVHLNRCGTWKYVEGLDRPLQPDATEPKGDGFYTVGVEIAPGKWKSTGTGDTCYWERLDDHQEILDNHVGQAGGTVTILDTDYEVHFNRCGTWERR